ncbi:hypothetical protein [Noviherbaspirillum galbum]|uniref:Uncharacterized protein n=1 Tax=Noviherbaspirillum galbum TaxID=2709383 RepID=A0A6B3SRZ4_9BURK|nr:hypothetical protein [Noviherbaspirillum galbum]NEX60419.1 hypothetical protein [Noviherbaspirillum galbum]
MQRYEEKDPLDPLKTDDGLSDKIDGELVDDDVSSSEVARRISLLGKLVIPPAVP